VEPFRPLLMVTMLLLPSKTSYDYLPSSTKPSRLWAAVTTLFPSKILAIPRSSCASNMALMVVEEHTTNWRYLTNYCCHDITTCSIDLFCWPQLILIDWWCWTCSRTTSVRKNAKGGRCQWLSIDRMSLSFVYPYQSINQSHELHELQTQKIPSKHHRIHTRNRTV